MTGRLVKTTEAAEAIGIAPRTLRQWARDGLVTPALRTRGGNRRHGDYRWNLDTLRDQLDQARLLDTPEPEPAPEVPEPPTERVPFLEWLDHDPGSRAAAQAVIDTVGRLITDKRAPYGTVSHARRRVDQLRATYGIPRPTL